MQWVEAHPVRLEGNFWVCDFCGRRIQITPFEIVEKGNQYAVHFDPNSTIKVSPPKIKNDRL